MGVLCLNIGWLREKYYYKITYIIFYTYYRLNNDTNILPIHLVRPIFSMKYECKEICVIYIKLFIMAEIRE